MMGPKAAVGFLFCFVSIAVFTSCRGTPSRTVALPQEQQEQRVFSLPDKPIPPLAEWLDRLQATPGTDVDLVEAATVLSSARLDMKRPYLSIPNWLEPYVRRAKSSLRPDAGAEEKIEALNKELLPAIQKHANDELRWLTDTLGGGEGGCVVFTLLYVIASDAISLRLDVVCLPGHVFPCYRGNGPQRNVESTGKGQHMTFEGYRKFLSEPLPDMDTLPEEVDALARQFTPITRRQFVSLLMTQTGGKKNRTDEDMEAAMRLAPDFYLPLRMQAGRCMAKKDFIRAGDLVSKAIELAPYVPGLYASRSTVRMAENKFVLAKGDLEAALKLSPHHGYFHHIKSILLSDQGQIWEALEAATLAVQNSPKVAGFWRARGLLYEKLKKYNEAISDFTQAIALEPKDGPTYRSRSLMWAMVGNEKEYEADRKKAEELWRNRR